MCVCHIACKLKCYTCVTCVYNTYVYQCNLLPKCYICFCVFYVTLVYSLCIYIYIWMWYSWSFVSVYTKWDMVVNRIKNMSYRVSNIFTNTLCIYIYNISNGFGYLHICINTDNIDRCLLVHVCFIWMWVGSLYLLWSNHWRSFQFLFIRVVRAVVPFDDETIHIRTLCVCIYIYMYTYLHMQS